MVVKPQQYEIPLTQAAIAKFAGRQSIAMTRPFASRRPNGAFAVDLGADSEASPGTSGKKLYLLGLLLQRLEYRRLSARREQRSLYHATEVLIEDKVSGTQLIWELIANGCHGVARYQSTMDKIMRLHAQTTAIENGFVYNPESAPWLTEYLHEMTVSPNGKRDDQVDSTAQFLDWFKTSMPCWGIFKHTRRMAEKLKAPEPVYVPRLGATRNRLGPDLLGPAYHHRRGSHR
jgi:predicted phage terminase large subunit-like protein